jgi:hypothetical protein
MHTETETRWIVLGTDGRHVSLGRTEPSETEIATANDALAAQGISGWLPPSLWSQRSVSVGNISAVNQ